jgi:glucokinase
VTRRLGLDIGGTNIKLAVLEDERLVDTRSTPTDAVAGPSAVLERAVGLGEAVGGVDSVGVCLPGVFDEEAGTALVANLPGDWSALDVRAELARGLGREVAVLNDGHAFGLAESRLGAGRGARDVLCVVCGTGVGGAIVLDGRLHRGVGGRAGEIGHTSVAPDGPVCACGNRGCLELYAGARAIARAAGRETFEETATAARDGDERAAGAIREAGTALGIALANAVMLLMPERVAVGGGTVAATGNLLLDVAGRELESRAAGIAPLDTIAVVPAELGAYAGAIGAALAGDEP